MKNLFFAVALILVLTVKCYSLVDEKKISLLYKLSLAELTSQAENGDTDAMFILGQRYDSRYYETSITNPNFEKSIYWYRKSAEEGHPWGVSAFIQSSANGPATFMGDRVENWETDWKSICEGAALIKKHNIPISKGSGISGFDTVYISECYFYGLMVEEDIVTGVAILEQSADLGLLADISAAHKLSDIYKNGEYGVPINIDKAIYFKKLVFEKQAYFRELFEKVQKNR